MLHWPSGLDGFRQNSDNALIEAVGENSAREDCIAFLPAESELDRISPHKCFQAVDLTSCRAVLGKAPISGAAEVYSGV